MELGGIDSVTNASPPTIIACGPIQTLSSIIGNSVSHTINVNFISTANGDTMEYCDVFSDNSLLIPF